MRGSWTGASYERMRIEMLHRIDVVHRPLGAFGKIISEYFFIVYRQMPDAHFFDGAADEEQRTMASRIRKDDRPHRGVPALHPPMMQRDTDAVSAVLKDGQERRGEMPRMMRRVHFFHLQCEMIRG